MQRDNFIDACETPAFILDQAELTRNVRAIKAFAAQAGCRALFSLKALAVREVITTVAESLDGFSVSSLFEARLARQVAGDGVLLHYVSPLIRDAEASEIAELCDRVTLNSLMQFERFAGLLNEKCDVGIRVNPRLSSVDDPRYDPCRADSKLGISLECVHEALHSDSGKMRLCSGLHFHSNRGSRDAGQLVSTIERIETVLGDDLHRLRWLNVGGGYSFDDEFTNELAAQKLRRLRELYGLELIIEPGTAIVGSAGCFVATVADIVDGDAQPIALLDFTVNHWPEIFEYQIQPDIAGGAANGTFRYLLAGCSCLAGDLFGVYTFNVPLAVGSRVVFPNAGAYSIGKAHTFNGINLPNIYVLTTAGELELVKRFTYEDFASRCGVEAQTSVGT